MTSPWSGSYVALITPFLPDESIDYDSLERLLAFHLDAGTDGLVVAGTTGESMALSGDEKVKLSQFVVDIVAGQIPVVVSGNAHGTQLTVHLTRQLLATGADACLLTTPANNKPMQHGLLAHYQTIAEAIDGPILLYNSPDRNMCDLRPETVAELAQIEHIVGFKETVGAGRVAELIRICPDEFAVLAGDDAESWNMIQAGACGIISVTGNLVPDMLKSFYHTHSKREQWHQQLLPLHQALYQETNPIPIKWACWRRGLINNQAPRLPLTTFSHQYHASLLAVMQNAGII